MEVLLKSVCPTIINRMRTINNVLLVDDDLIFNMINEKFIQKSTFAFNVVGCYVNATEALKFLSQLIKTNISQFPNIIFMDINMPEMSCWKFLDELNKFPQSVLKECRVFALTSTIVQEDVEKSKAYKMMCDFISKPLTSAKLEMLFSPSTTAVTP